MSSNSHLKDKAISLRKEGKSYNVIRKALGIASKGTLSYWFKNLELSEVSKELLENNKRLAYQRGLFNANKNRKERIDKENSAARSDGFDSIPSLSRNDLKLVGVALYWAEGTKSERGTARSLIFSNSDPDMIKIFMSFIREILKTPEEKIRAGIHIYDTISEDEARKFWSKITKLPEDRFYIVNQVSRASKRNRPFNILPYGTAAIKINNRKEFYKMKGMIEAVRDKLIR